MKIVSKNNELNEICKNCGFTHGLHNASDYYSEYYEMYIPRDYCPAQECRIDRDNSQRTTFNPTGRYKEEEE